MKPPNLPTELRGKKKRSAQKINAENIDTKRKKEGQQEIQNQNCRTVSLKMEQLDTIKLLSCFIK